jgi:hypothetical protein
MDAVRNLFLLCGLVSLVGGASQVPSSPTAVPWTRVESHVRRTLAPGSVVPVARVELLQSFQILVRAGVTTDRR